MAQTWRLAYDYGIGEATWLPMGPVVSVESVQLFDAEDNGTALSTNQFYLNAARDMLLMHTEVQAQRVEIVYEAGYGTADDVPMPIKLGLLAHVAQLYDNRGEMGEAGLPVQASSLYLPFREMRL